jgi:uncharacterized membrane protein
MPSATFVPVAFTVVAHAPIKDVYDRWNRIEEFPSFMEGVREIAWLDERRFNLVSESGGKLFTSICEVTLRIPERRIAWRTLSGPDSSGVVCFQNAGGGRTEVTLKMRYDPSTGWKDREQLEARLQRNLRRFKDLVERALASPAQPAAQG